MSTKVFQASFAAAVLVGAAVLVALAGPALAIPAMSSPDPAGTPPPHEAPDQLAGRGQQGRADERGSSAEIYGGSSADRYGGSSADRNGRAGERDVRVHGRPKRAPKEKEPKKPAQGEQQDEGEER